MNCCGGGEHNHGGDGQNGNNNGHDNSGPSWLPMAALLLIGVLVAGLLFAFIK
ncbi:MAG: hypothetical protein HY544_02085 [Candidatus Diapherotrites archaeon]|uniref:Uncharacterized protein n=1 Tax=Candidatus Iainarchaeum sp. TaxID=3101447 RepID=A0A8T3YIA8_9ARCH|nr:hypothetical protein [Candidatus Diapherotrites archaeon]